MDNYKDEDIVRLYRQNKDAYYFELLFERYNHLVFGLCLKYLKNQADAEDMVMHIFEKLMLELTKQEVQYFKSWLYRVSKNECLMVLRKSKPVDSIEDIPDIFMESPNDLHLNEEEEKEKRLHHGLEQLKEEQKICLELFYFKDLTYVEISNQTGYTEKQVKSFIQNGKRNLRLFMMSTINSWLLFLIWLRNI